MKKLVVALLLIFLFSPVVSDAQEPSASALFLQALMMEQEGDYDGAYETYQQILSKESTPTIYLRLVHVEFARGNTGNAHKLLRQAQKNFPDNADVAFQSGALSTVRAEQSEAADERAIWLKDAQHSFQNAARIAPTEQNYVALASVSVQMKDYAAAMNVYDKLIKDLGKDEYYRHRGVLKLETGDREGGIADLEIACSQNDDVQAMIRLADLYLKDNDTDTALEYLLTASELRPDLVVPDLYLGEIFRDRNDYERSVHFYMQAARHMDGKVRNSVLKQIGALALEKEDFATALEAYRIALEDTKNDPQLFYLAGYAAASLKDGRTAQQIFDEGVDLFPEYSMLRKRSAVNLLLMGKAEEAVKVLSGIDEMERDVQYYLLLSDAYSNLSSHRKAVEVLKEGYRENPQNMDIMFGLAAQYEKLKQHDDTIKILKEVLKIDPDSPVAQNFLGYVYADLNIHLDEAEALIDRALAQEPDNYAYMDSKAWVLFRKGKYEEAYALLKKALEQRPDDPELNSHMEQIQEKLKIIR